MTPREFVEKYPIGTKFTIDLELYEISGHNDVNGTYTYLGTKYCQWENGCGSWCRGKLTTKDEHGVVKSGCFSFHNDNIDNSMPLAFEPFLSEAVTDELPEELFEI